MPVAIATVPPAWATRAPNGSRSGLPSYCRDFPPLNYAGMRLDDKSTALSVDGVSVASHFFGQSSFAGHAIVRARNVVKVVGSAAPLASLGPLGCGFQTGAGGVMRSLACPAGSSITIFGGGPVGLAAVMGARIQGCSTIIGTATIRTMEAT